MMGDFNADIAHLEGADQYEEIAAALAEVGLEDMPEHFLPRQRP